ncbi:hypothetical protein [Streptomyces sp. AC602_WCS936]|nr:hypothetical protein [Streptomyces sp. AC602_WCS936]
MSEVGVRGTGEGDASLLQIGDLVGFQVEHVKEADEDDPHPD